MAHLRASANFGYFVVKLALMVSIAYEQITTPTGFQRSLIRGVSEIAVDAGR